MTVRAISNIDDNKDYNSGVGNEEQPSILGATTNPARQQVGCFATRRIKAGEVVMRERCIAAEVLDDEVAMTCAWCLERSRNEKPLSRCSKCSKTLYCSADCQRNHWRNGHRKLCGKDLDCDARVVYRLAQHLLALPTEYNVSSSVLAAPADAFVNLTCNYAATRTKERARQVLEALTTLELPATCLRSLTSARTIYTVCAQNNFGVLSSTRIPLAAAVFPFAALLNHSCVANVGLRYVLVPHSLPVLELVAITDIEAGSELVHSYVDNFTGTTFRQHHLRSIYGFTCACERCLHSWQADEELRSEREPSTDARAALTAAEVGRSQQVVSRHLDAARKLLPSASLHLRPTLQRLCDSAMLSGDFSCARAYQQELISIESRYLVYDLHPQLEWRRQICHELEAFIGLRSSNDN